MKFEYLQRKKSRMVKIDEVEAKLIFSYIS